MLEAETMRPEVGFTAAVIFSRILLALLLLAVGILATAPQGTIPVGSSNDKLNHFVAFFVISAVACSAFPRTKRWFILAALLIFNAMIELAQALMMNGRKPELLDFVVGAAATFLVVVGGRLLRGPANSAPRPN